MAEKHAFWSSIGGILTGLAAIITAGVAVYTIGLEETNSGKPIAPATDPKVTAPTQQPKESRCSDPWEWDKEVQKCVRKITVARKTFSIPLEKTVSEMNGRIDFYLNTERMPGTDQNGRARYRSAPGALQVVIPVMLGKTMVGDLREVIYSTNEGAICKVSSLPETTGHLKKMRVRYSLRLADCQGAGSFCQAAIVSPGKRVHIEMKPLTVTISKSC